MIPKRRRHNKQSPVFATAKTKEGVEIPVPMNRKARALDRREHRKEIVNQTEMNHEKAMRIAIRRQNTANRKRAYERQVEYIKLKMMAVS